MSSTVLGSNPLSVLVVSNDGTRFGPGFLSGLGRHCSLFCQSVSQALEPVSQFAPEIVLIDHAVVDGEALVSVLGNRVKRRQTFVIQLTRTNLPTEPQSRVYRQLMMPATESELASEILQIRNGLKAEFSESRTSA